MHESFDVLNQTKIEIKSLSTLGNNMKKMIGKELENIILHSSANDDLLSKYFIQIQIIQEIKQKCVNNLVTQINKRLKQQLDEFYRKIKEELEKNNPDYFDNIIFLQIARKLGFPIYLEIYSDLKDKLMASYRKNNNEYNILEMQNIILDYYNDGYVKCVLNRIQNVSLYNRGRVSLVEEGIEIYLKGYYGGSSTIFATQLSGMILDVYNLLNAIYRYSNEEKKKLLFQFRQGGRTDSEKSMLLQVICRQKGGSVLWYAVLRYFFDVIYSSKDTDMDTQPKRHKICHGIQTNINTKIMSLKLIMCMDIITELAWRVENMKAESKIICET